jgi:hypothetical protein
MSRLPPQFVGFLVGQLLKSGRWTDARAAQSDALGIVEAWNKLYPDSRTPAARTPDPGRRTR